MTVEEEVAELLKDVSTYQDRNGDVWLDRDDALSAVAERLRQRDEIIANLEAGPIDAESPFARMCERIGALEHEIREKDILLRAANELRKAVEDEFAATKDMDNKFIADLRERIVALEADLADWKEEAVKANAALAKSLERIAGLEIEVRERENHATALREGLETVCGKLRESAYNWQISAKEYRKRNSVCGERIAALEKQLAEFREFVAARAKMTSELETRFISLEAENERLRIVATKAWGEEQLALQLEQLNAALAGRKTTP